jgi:hypothetical protein
METLLIITIWLIGSFLSYVTISNVHKKIIEKPTKGDIVFFIIGSLISSWVGFLSALVVKYIFTY